MNRNLELGINYYNGDDGFPEDVDKAVIYLERALKENCYEAAYYLGLCYYEGLGEKKLDIEIALKYMEQADYHYVDDATEWLADYYEDSDIEKYFDYALDLPNYLKKKSNNLIRKLKNYFDSIDRRDYLVVIDSIELFEFWWKRIKQKESELCRQVSKCRNDSLRLLCELLEDYVFNEDIYKEINGFLGQYKHDTKLDFISEWIEKANYRFIMHQLNLANSLEQFELFKNRACTLREPYSTNLLSYVENRKAIFITTKCELNDANLQFIKDYYRTNTNAIKLMKDFLNAIAIKIEELLTECEYDKAKKLCNVFPSTDNNHLILITKIHAAEISNQPVLVESNDDKYLRLEKTYKETLSQIDFNRCFDFGWSLGKYNVLCSLMVFAKNNKTSFEYVHNKYRDRFLKLIVSNLPKSFFNDDIAFIEKEIKRRGIKELIHFTPIENRKSILDYGLYSRNKLESSGIKAIYTDSERYDGFNDYISISITNKNYKMMWNKIYNNIMRNGVEVFIIRPEILYEHPESVVYCSCNASRRDSINHMNYGYRGLMNMFATDDGTLNSTNNPTDIQAEILFKGTIDKKYIIEHYTEVITSYGKKNGFYSNRR